MVKRLTLLAALVVSLAVLCGGSYDRGGYASKGGYLGGMAEQWSGEVKTAMFAMDTLNTYDHFSDRFDAYRDSADYLYKLGENCPEFAYGFIDTTSLPDGLISADYWSMLLAGSFDLNDAKRRCRLIYIDWAKYIPEGATVVSAVMNGMSYSADYYNYADTTIAVLMSAEGDSSWYQKTEAGSPAALVSWRNQQETNLGAPADVPWIPSLAVREHYWEECSQYSDWSGGPVDAASSTPSGTVHTIPITNCVQAAVNGETNNGIMFFGEGAGSWSSQGVNLTSFDATSTRATKRPWFEVKYIERPYAAPFPENADWAFIFTTDDGIQPANRAWIDTFKSYGMEYSIFIAGTQVGGLYNADADTLIAWHDVDGMEVGPHTIYHRAASTYYAGITDTSHALFDSCQFDYDPDWLYDLVEAVDGDRREDEPNFGKSMAMSNNNWTPETARVFCDMGYLGVRIGNMTPPSFHATVFDYFTAATAEPARADSMRTGFSANRYGVDPDWAMRPANFVGAPTSYDIDDLTGGKNAALTDEETFKTNFRRVIYRLIGQNRRVFLTFAHDFKTGESNADYDDVIDKEELGWMLQVVEETNGVAMTLSDYSRWMRQWATPVATPASYAQPDTFKYRADDEIWYIPNGMDGRFIRGWR